MMQTIKVLLLLSFIVLLTGCGNKEEENNMRQAPSITQGSGGGSSAAGVSWTVPGGWKQEGDRPMRVATYSVPAAEGDAEGGECAVFHFGSDQGGDVAANIQRWVTQFENPSGPDQSASEIQGMKVTSVKIAGTYLAPSGPMMQSAGKKENYRLLGAIVEAPEGSVFFKFTGPAKTVDAASDEFNKMIQSIRK
jgi:hypothetical protein